MSILGYALGFDALVVGIEPDPVEVDDEGNPLTRIYIDARYLNRYVLVAAADGERIRQAWGAQHLVIPRPPVDSILPITNPPTPGATSNEQRHIQ